jgi:hypothetical protein
LLEKYIDQRLHYEAPVEEFDVPADLLVRAMVKTSYLPGNITLTGKDVTGLLDPDKAYKVALRIVGRKAAAAAPAAHMTAMRGAIEVAARSRQNAACNHAHAQAKLATAYKAWIEAEAEARAVTPPIMSPPPEVDCTDAQLSIDLARSALDALQGAPGKLPWQDAPLNQREAWLRDLAPGLRGNLTAAEKRYEAAAADLKHMATIDTLSREWADDVEEAARAYMLASQRAAVIMVRNSEPIPPDAHRKRSLLFPYKAWRVCWSAVLRGGPAEAARATCRRIDDLDADRTLTEVALPAALGDSGWRKVFFAYVDFDQWLDETVYDLATGATGVVNPSLSGLLEAMLEPERISRERLDKAFRAGGNGQLKFQCVSDWIDLDLGLMARPAGALDPKAECIAASRHIQSFDPTKFQPVVHAVTLGKLALLGREEVRRLAGPVEVKLGAGSGPYSVILDTVRSLDGAHQWQGYSLPPPRQRGLDRTEAVRGAGYPLGKDTEQWTIHLDKRVRDSAADRPGFPYYQTTALRRDVFARLFPLPFEGEILSRVEYGPRLYPLRACDGDPFRPAHIEPEREVLCLTREGDVAPGWVVEERKKGELTGWAKRAAEQRLEELKDNRQVIETRLKQAYEDAANACFGRDLAKPDNSSISRWKGCLRLGRTS